MVAGAWTWAGAVLRQPRLLTSAGGAQGSQARHQSAGAGTWLALSIRSVPAEGQHVHTAPYSAVTAGIILARTKKAAL